MWLTTVIFTGTPLPNQPRRWRFVAVDGFMGVTGYVLSGLRTALSERSEECRTAVDEAVPVVIGSLWTTQRILSALETSDNQPSNN